MQIVKHASEGSILALSRQMSPDVQNRGISDPIKIDNVLQNNF